MPTTACMLWPTSGVAASMASSGETPAARLASKTALTTLLRQLNTCTLANTPPPRPPRSRYSCTIFYEAGWSLSSRFTLYGKLLQHVHNSVVRSCLLFSTHTMPYLCASLDNQVSVSPRSLWRMHFVTHCADFLSYLSWVFPFFRTCWHSLDHVFS